MSCAQKMPLETDVPFDLSVSNEMCEETKSSVLEEVYYDAFFYPENKEQLFFLHSLDNISFSYVEDTLNTVNSSDENSTGGLCARISCDKPKMPIMRSLWPSTLPFPISIPVVIQDTVIINTASSPGDGIKANDQGVYHFPLYVRTYDSFLNQYVPMRNMKVKMSYGAATSYAYTNSSGYVLLTPNLYTVHGTTALMNVSISLVFESAKWMIVRENNTSSIQRVLGTVGSIWGLPTTGQSTAPAYYANVTSNSTECEIHRAVDYYFNSTHYLSSYINTSELGIIIHAMDNDGTAPAYTTFSQVASPTITVNNGYDYQNDCIGSVIHELGHVHHYYNLGGYSSFMSANDLLVESYASFVGWAIGEQYYLSKGYIKPNPGSHINWQNRQGWTPATTPPNYYYSPFFIDLLDTFCQSSITDYIDGVAVSIIEGASTACSTVQQCKNYLYANGDDYYTASQIVNQLSYY